MATPQAINQLSLAPLGAGDLIDRAVRLYRRHFTTLIRIAAPPVLTQTLGSLMMTVAQHSTRLGGLAYLLIVVGFFLWVGGVLLNFIVMGGAFQGDGYRRVLFENPGHGNNWIKLKLVGVKSNRSARF